MRMAAPPRARWRRECAALVRAYGAEQLFRSRIVMARHGFGRGEYKYFA
jgi:hypothetical protein